MWARRKLEYNQERGGKTLINNNSLFSLNVCVTIKSTIKSAFKPKLKWYVLY